MNKKQLFKIIHLTCSCLELGIYKKKNNEELVLLYSNFRVYLVI